MGREIRTLQLEPPPELGVKEGRGRHRGDIWRGQRAGEEDVVVVAGFDLAVDGPVMTKSVWDKDT